jgi:hypothetical protein
MQAPARRQQKEFAGAGIEELSVETLFDGVEIPLIAVW